jgi:hypothetical protein
VRAAEDFTTGSFHAVTDDFAAAMITFRSDYRNGALEAIENMRLTLSRDLEGLIVIVSAKFTSSHHN